MTKSEMIQKMLKAIETELNGMTKAELESLAKGETVTATSKKQTATPKVDLEPRVLRVDKYGNKWIAEYNDAVYRKKKHEMMQSKKYKGHASVYKALGWIL